MNILFSKEQKACATCVYWNGLKELIGDSLNVDFLSYGKCLNPDNAHIKVLFVASATCLKYALNPALENELQLNTIM
jgi:hypothetical protein